MPEDNPAIASLTVLWSGANWLERETYDLYGIRFDGHPDLRRIYLYDEFVGHPLRKDYAKHDEQPIEPYAGPEPKNPVAPTDASPADPSHDLHTPPMRMQIGPSHPATHGTVKIVLDLDGERVVKADIQVGYLHRGFEKECETGYYYQNIPYTDRLNYSSPMLNNVGYCLAVEKLFGSRTPPRCEYHPRDRGRDLAHEPITCCASARSALELAALTPFLYLLEARELMCDLLDALCGARVTTNYVRIGGVSADLPEGFDRFAAERLDRSLAPARRRRQAAHAKSGLSRSRGGHRPSGARRR